MTTISISPQQTLKFGQFVGSISYNDIVLDDYGKNIVLSKEDTAISQVARGVVLTHRGELQYNVNKGIPYIPTILSDSNLIPIWQSYVQEAIINVSNVGDIQYFEIEYDRQNSSLSYRCGFTTDYGRIELNERYI